MKIQRAIQFLCNAATLVASVALVGMALLVTADVLWDFLFGRPITNTVEIVSVYFMVALVFFPLGAVELRHQHISADILVRMLPSYANKILYLFTGIVSIAFILIMFYQTGLDALSAMKRQEMIMGTNLLIVWPSRFSLPIGYALLALAMAANLLQSILPTDESNKG